MKWKRLLPIRMIGIFTILINLISATHADEVELETITVTAQKAEEDITKIPMSVSAFSEIQIENAGIDNSGELTRFSPNVFMKKSTTENIVLIRGISSFETSVYSPTGFYVDDINLPLHYMHNVSLFDVERVEILKGPQGTLYGRNNEAGVINIITRQPEGPLSGKVFAEPSTYSGPGSHSLKAGFGLNIPLVEEELSLGLYAQHEKSKGYMKNLYNDDEEAGKIDHQNYRANLRWTPSEVWDISFIGDSVKFDDEISYYRFINGPKETKRYEVSHDNNEYSIDDGLGQTLRIKYAGEAFNLLSVTGSRSYKNENVQDADCYSDPDEDYGAVKSIYKNSHLSQEVRFVSADDSSVFKWIVGFYTFKETTNMDLNNATTGVSRETDINIQGNALFTQATYTIIENLKLTAGLRLDAQEQKGEQEYISGGSRSTYEKDLVDQETLPKLAISYDVNDDILVYLLASKGYMSGGYNYSSASSKSSFSYKPEYTANKEMGVKSNWFAGALSVNLVYFNIDMTDKQVSQLEDDMSEVRIENAAKANASGFELELTARPAHGLTLSAGYGMTDAKYLEYEAKEYSDDYSSVEVNDYEGKKVANIPARTFNVGLQYRHGSGLSGRVDVLGTGKSYIDSANTAEMSAYSLVNVRLGYETESYDVFLWGDNVFDQEYQTVQYYWGEDILGQDGKPAHFGISFIYRFI